MDGPAIGDHRVGCDAAGIDMETSLGIDPDSGRFNPGMQGGGTGGQDFHAGDDIRVERDFCTVHDTDIPAVFPDHRSRAAGMNGQNAAIMNRYGVSRSSGRNEHAALGCDRGGVCDSAFRDRE